MDCYTLTCEVTEGLLWELLYVDDLLLVVESMEGVEGEGTETKRVHGGKRVDKFQGRTVLMLTGQ